MKRNWIWLAVASIALILASEAAAQPKLDLKTSIEVDGAVPWDVYESISRTLGCELVMAPEIRQPVTMHLQNVTVRTALTALSESLGCRWHIEGNVLHVEPVSVATGVRGGVPGGAKGGVAGGVAGGVPGGVVGGVPGGGAGSSDFKQRLERKTPASFRFDGAPLETVMNALGKIADLDMGVDKSDAESLITVDLSDRTILAALKTIRRQFDSSKPIVFSAALPGSDKKMLLKVGAPKKNP